MVNPAAIPDSSTAAASPHDTLIRELRELLLEDDRRSHQLLQERVETLIELLSNREKLEPCIEPIIDDKLTTLRQRFPDLFGPVITQTIKVQTRESQDEIVEALYPILGKLIKRYIVREMELLSEKIDQQLSRTFSVQRWKTSLRSWLGGVKQEDMIRRNLMEPSVEEVFVIEQESGILRGSYSRNNVIDQDMIAGMLTAIKSFVGEAFMREHQDLEIVEYETYKLIIKNFKSFYIAVIVSGVIHSHFRNELDDTILNLAEDLGRLSAADALGNETALLAHLQSHFAKYV